MDELKSLFQLAVSLGAYKNNNLMGIIFMSFSFPSLHSCRTRSQEADLENQCLLLKYICTFNIQRKKTKLRTGFLAGLRYMI